MIPELKSITALILFCSASIFSSGILAKSYEQIESIPLSKQEYEKLSKPIGPITGTFYGGWNFFDVKLDMDSVHPFIEFREKRGKGRQKIISAEISRQGKILKIGYMNCLQRVDRRQWFLGQQYCEAINEGLTLIIERAGTGKLKLASKGDVITLSRSANRQL